VHELSLCRAIADAVTTHAAGRRVERVRLRIGHFRQVVPDTLVYCWGIHTETTPLAGSTLVIHEVPAIVECSCGSSTTLELPVLRCSTCGSSDVRLVSGEEFLIESIDVSDHDPVAEEVP
jgi:hydrogenase nickel incorporation protein HypA/HybF